MRTQRTFFRSKTLSVNPWTRPRGSIGFIRALAGFSALLYGELKWQHLVHVSRIYEQAVTTADTYSTIANLAAFGTLPVLSSLYYIDRLQV
jgi:hypothetical protein